MPPSSESFTEGDQVTIKGRGFMAGDVIKLLSQLVPRSTPIQGIFIDATTVSVDNTQIVFTIPEGFSSGENRVTLRRGDDTMYLGWINLYGGNSLVGSWSLIYEQGYEIDNNWRREWNGEATWNQTYTFNPDNTGICEYNNGTPGDYEITWSYDPPTGKFDVVSVEDADSPFNFTIYTLTSTSLILERRIIQNNTL